MKQICKKKCGGVQRVATRAHHQTLKVRGKAMCLEFMRPSVLFIPDLNELDEHRRLTSLLTVHVSSFFFLYFLRIELMDSLKQNL